MGARRLYELLEQARRSAMRLLAARIFLMSMSDCPGVGTVDHVRGCAEEAKDLFALTWNRCCEQFNPSSVEWPLEPVLSIASRSRFQR